MGLNDVVEESDPKRYVEQRHEKFMHDNMCPGCGEESEHIRGNEWKCTNSNGCDVIKYFVTDIQVAIP